MIDNLGFHTERDLAAELATLNREIRILEVRITTGAFNPFEDRHNAWGQLDNLRSRAEALTQEIAAEDFALNRLADAIHTVGDVDLGFIAYVVFGPAALPVQPLYDVRVIERRGDYTVPDAVRRNVPADDVARTEAELLDLVMARGGHADLWGLARSDFRTQATAY